VPVPVEVTGPGLRPALSDRGDGGEPACPSPHDGLQPDVTRAADVLARGSDHQVGETVTVEVGGRERTAGGGDRDVGVSVTVEVGTHGRRGIGGEGARRSTFGVGHRCPRPRHGDDGGGGHVESPK
jgi:hypothetical protein